MTMDDKKTLIERMSRLVEDMAAIAGILDQALTPDGPAPDTPADTPAEAPAKAPEKEYTYEEARAVLAEKSRTGFRAEVKAILTRHDVNQLSDVKDPKMLATIVAEAEAIHIG